MVPARTFPELISVVIPARNAARLIAGQLEALSGQTHPGRWEVVVVDNGSTDATAERARRWSSALPSLRVVSAADRVGVNYARNVGAAAARGDFIVFCDADDVATPTWLERMAAAARTADLVGGYLDFDLLNSPRERSWRTAQPRESLPVLLGFLPYAWGSCLGVRAAVFRALGGFDESYARGNDDVEFCWRAQLSAYSLVLAPNAVMNYRLRDGLLSLVRQGYGYGRSDPQLFRDYRWHGVAPADPRTALKVWVALARRLPDLASADRNGRWLYTAAYRLGRLAGSARHRVFYP
jgi:glycosyltransferase involved in cell wall biosynthesis